MNLIYMIYFHELLFKVLHPYVAWKSQTSTLQSLIHLAVLTSTHKYASWPLVSTLKRNLTVPFVQLSSTRGKLCQLPGDSHLGRMYTSIGAFTCTYLMLSSNLCSNLSHLS